MRTPALLHLVFCGAVAACGGSARTSAPATTAAPATAEPPKKTDVPWVHDDFAGALATAKRENKPLFVDAWALWCHTCLSMQKFVFPDPALAPLHDRFVWAAIDTEKPESAAFLEAHPIDAYPTFLILDPADGSVAARWPGSMSLQQLRTFLEEGERAIQLAHAGQLAPGDPLALLRAGDKAVQQKQFGEAARLYARARVGAPPDWPRRAEALTSEVRSLGKAGEHGACVDLALVEMGSTGNGPNAGDLVAYALGCAEKLPKEDPRVATLRKAGHDRLVALVQDAAAPLSADDRGDIWRMVWDLRETAGDTAGAKDAARARIALLDEAAARAPDAEAASTFDWARAESLLYLDRGADAVARLTESERRLPNDYNPPARLARVHYTMKNYAEALAAMERALPKAYGPRKGGLLALKADILEKQGNRAAARAVVEEQLALYRSLPQKKPELEAAAEKRLQSLR
jgi:tetratricopeptide (TPR) repeat protein